MAKKMIREIKPHIALYRDTTNGIAWIEDGTTGLRHSCHPNIDASGSVTGMKRLGYWDKTDDAVRAHGFIYNISRFFIDKSDELDQIVADECMCQGCMARRQRDIIQDASEQELEDDFSEALLQ